MGKMVLKKAGAAATQSVLRDFMPEFDDRLNAIVRQVEAIQNDVRALDAKFDTLREDMMDRFERQLAVINEISHRVTRLEGKLEGYMEAMRHTLQPAKPSAKRRVG